MNTKRFNPNFSRVACLVVFAIRVSFFYIHYIITEWVKSNLEWKMQSNPMICVKQMSS